MHLEWCAKVATAWLDHVDGRQHRGRPKKRWHDDRIPQRLAEDGTGTGPKKLEGSERGLCPAVEQYKS